MNKYVYFDNQKWPVSPVLFECVAKTISVADDLMIAKLALTHGKINILGVKSFRIFRRVPRG